MIFKFLGLYLDKFSPRKVGIVVVSAVLILCLIYLGLMLILNVGENKGKNQPDEFERELVSRAKELYYQHKKAGLDMSTGPCLTNQLVKNWVVDVAHEPRLSLDDLPKNQCDFFRQGKAE